MKVLFFVADLYRGGVASVTCNLLRGLAADNGFDISVCIYQDVPICHDLPSEVRLYRLNVPLSRTHGYTPLRRMARGLSRYPGISVAFFRLLKLVRDIRPNIIVSMSGVLNILNICLAPFQREWKGKAILVDHVYRCKQLLSSSFATMTSGRLLELLAPFFYSRADAAVCISRLIGQQQAQELAVHQDRIWYIPNPIDTARIQRQGDQHLGGYAELFGARVVVTAGRLTTQKGHWHLIRAFKQVKDRVKDARLLVLGAGELDRYLNLLLSDLGLQGDVVMTGHVRNPFNLISNATVFVFPSLWEGFGMSLVEALACGVPVISTDCCSGPRDILAPDTDFCKQAREPEFAQYGVLIPRLSGKFYHSADPLDRTEQMLADTMVSLLTNKSLRQHYSIAGARRARDFAVNVVAESWKRLFESLAAN